MVEIYGHKFTSAFGDEPNESWVRCLGEISPPQIANGLNRLQHREDDWPPTALEFRRLCLNQRTMVEAQQARQSEGRVALPPPHVNPGKAFFDALRGEA